jgi:solute carrier family 35 protein F1/2
MGGVIMNVLHDYQSDSKTGAETTTENDLYPQKLLGDILATIGGIMYGINDTLIEATLRKNESTAEYLAMVGILAFLLSFVQAMILERDSIMMFFGENPDAIATCSLFKGWALLFIFVGVTVCSYMGGSRFLMISEAAFFNLSLLTGDFWSLAFSVFYQKIVPRPLFFVALTFVLSGVVLYEMAPHPVVDDDKHEGRTIQQRLAEIDSEFELQQGHEESIEFGDDDDEDNDIELL